MIRTIKITNKAIFDGLKEKDKFVEEGRKLTDKIESMETQRNTVGMKIQKVKDRIIPLIEEEVKAIELGEFETVGDVKATSVLNEVEIEVFDQVEAYKEYILDEKKKKEQANADSDSTPSEEQPVVEEPAAESEEGK